MVRGRLRKLAPIPKQVFKSEGRHAGSNPKHDLRLEFESVASLFTTIVRTIGLPLECIVYRFLKAGIFPAFFTCRL